MMETGRPQVKWFYKRVKVQDYRERVIFELASGLSYLLRSFLYMQPEYKIVAGPLTIGFPFVGAEFQSGSGDIRYQLDPIPAPVYSAPRFDGVVTKTETAPFPGGYGINMSAAFKPRENKINLFYDVGETIVLILSGQQYFSGPAIWGPDYIDIALQGVYIP